MSLCFINFLHVKDIHSWVNCTGVKPILYFVWLHINHFTSRLRQARSEAQQEPWLTPCPVPPSCSPSDTTSCYIFTEACQTLTPSHLQGSKSHHLCIKITARHLGVRQSAKQATSQSSRQGQKKEGFGSSCLAMHWSGVTNNLNV